MSANLPQAPKDLQNPNALARWFVLLWGAVTASQKGEGIPQYSSAPPYKKGAVYFDTTLNKLRVGGATGWETVTSS